MRISFRVKLLVSHAAVAVAVSAVSFLVVERALSSRMEAQVDRRLESQAEAVSRWLERARHPDRLAGRLAGVVGARVTIIDEKGEAVGESRDEADDGSTRADAKEIASARAGRIGRATRYSSLDNAHVRYIAVPAPDDSVVRLGLPIGEIDETKSDIRRQLGIGALASLVVALGLAVFMAGALTRKLRAAGELAERIGAGDYDVVAETDSTDEVGVLSTTLVTAAAELKETEARRREFLANVAHEIRTPVTSIRGYAETLDKADVDAETRREFVSTIHRNAVRIGSLVEDLLELEALQAGKAQPLADEDVSVARIAKHVADTLQSAATEQGATISLEVADDAVARGDADAIERVLLNLVGNAVRYGGRGVTIEVGGRTAGGRVHIHVKDDGPGIPDEHRTRVFERFHRVAERDAGGGGLGLPIARELAQAMGGTLSLAEADVGTLFEVDLPAGSAT